MQRMGPAPHRVGLILGTSLFAAALLAPPTYAGNGAPACKAHASAHKVCFPKKISGTFSGSSDRFKWTGKTTLKRKKQQTTYEYSGDATYTWQYRAGSGACTPSPSSGTLTRAVGMSVARTHNVGQGYYYSGGDGQGIGIGDLSWDCGYGPGTPTAELIVGAFDVGGTSKNLHTYKSGKYGDSISDASRWALFGSN
jgi:hypothetical protein